MDQSPDQLPNRPGEERPQTASFRQVSEEEEKTLGRYEGSTVFIPDDGGQEPPAGPRGNAVIAWIVIILTVGTIIWLKEFGPPSEAIPPGEQEAAERGEFPPDSEVELQLMEAQFKVLLRAPDESKLLWGGSIGLRFQQIVGVGEMIGPARARDFLEELDDEVAADTGGADRSARRLTESQQAVRAALRKLYGADSAEALADVDTVPPGLDQLTNDERDLLVQELEWFGELALHPEGGPDPDARLKVVESGRSGLNTLVLILLGIVLAGLIGFIYIILLISAAAGGRLPRRFDPGGDHHALYAETFAIWLVLFFGLQFAVALAPGLGLYGVIGAFLLSLIALTWPVMRGISWRQVRSDIGLTANGSVFGEILSGIGGYAMLLPMMLIGLAMALVTALIVGEPVVGDPFQPGASPHPAIDALPQGGATLILMLVLGSVCAPIVEETMFRGVLYRHLRDATVHFRIGVSIFFSALINGTIFAVIHPQPLVYSPVLIMLAIGFSLAREWRGGVLAPMIMHGISNGVVLGAMAMLLML